MNNVHILHNADDLKAIALFRADALADAGNFKGAIDLLKAEVNKDMFTGEQRFPMMERIEEYEEEFAVALNATAVSARDMGV